MIELPAKYADLKWWERMEVRELYAEKQDWKCYHCGGPLDEKPSGAVLRKRVNRRLFPQGFFDHPVHLHHSHETGLTIGTVHAYCNAVLWQYHGE